MFQFVSFPKYKSASLEIAEVQTSVGLVYR